MLVSDHDNTCDICCFQLERLRHLRLRGLQQAAVGGIGSSSSYRVISGSVSCALFDWDITPTMPTAPTALCDEGCLNMGDSISNMNT